MGIFEPLVETKYNTLNNNSKILNINANDNLALADKIMIEIIFRIIPSQREIKILIDEDKKIKELIELFLEQTGLTSQLFKNEILKFTINKEKIDFDSNEKIGNFFKKKNKIIIIEDNSNILKNINIDNIKCIFNIINWAEGDVRNVNILTGKKIKIFINKNNPISELIKLFMGKMSISNYYGREDLLQFYFNGKIVKHFSYKNVKKLKKGNNTINVIDPNYLIQKTNNIRFTFKTGSGIQNVININQNKNMSDLIKAYFDEIEMPYFYGSNIFTFLYNASKINFDNNEYIFNLMNKNNLNNNIIMVIDLNNLIQIKNNIFFV